MVYKDILRRRHRKNNSVSLLKYVAPEYIIQAPVLTEKTYKLADEKKYVFKVHKMANKNDIKNSINKLYGVDVKSVKIINLPGKWRSNRKVVRRPYKKAIITLIDWKIELF